LPVFAAAKVIKSSDMNVYARPFVLFFNLFSKVSTVGEVKNQDSLNLQTTFLARRNFAVSFAFIII